jgi:hypothetical protein
MERIYVFITICIASLIGAGATIMFGLHPACMMGTIIFIVAVILSLDVYFRERQEKEIELYAEIMAKDKAIKDYMKHFNINQPRAEQLYDYGFKNLSDFSDKSVEELIEFEDINPTLAKRIHQKTKGL